MSEEEYLTPQPCDLSKESVSNIAETIARELRYGVGNDIEPIIKKIGGKIVFKSIWDLMDGDSETIVISGVNNFEITLPEHTSTERDRFTIAHELGHYILHYLYLIQSNSSVANKKMRATRSGSPERAEYEANWFAASFLMPAAQFRSAYAKCEGSVFALSEKFGVSISAASIRAQSLKLL